MIKPFDYLKVLEEIEPEVLEAIRQMLHSGQLIHGPQTQAFEEEFAAWLGAPHCVGVASGTAAIHLALWALGIGPGDEVLTVANTCPPTVSAIRLTGAIPKFVDVDPATLLPTAQAFEAAISAQTKAIVVVHLWGSMVDMEAIMALSARTGVLVVEDCAQAVGASWKGKKAGTWGHAAAYSFYPTKNLGTYGDAGAVATDSPETAARLRRIRMYGYESLGTSLEEGTNARMHEMQAAILRVKLRHLDTWLDRRRALAQRYDAGIRHPEVKPVGRNAAEHHAFHQYVVQTPHRDRLADWLKSQLIGFGIHYATPIHTMPAYLKYAQSALPYTETGCSQVLSLPLHEALAEAEAEQVIQAVNSFPDV